MREIAICFVVILGLALPASMGQGRATAEDIANPAIFPPDRILGAANAPVTLIQYASPSCPVCAHFQVDAFPLIKEKYIDTGKVRFVFRVFPLRPEDGDAEKLARCAPHDGYFRFMDVLFRNQEKWDPEFGISDSRTQLIALATASGLTVEQAVSCNNEKSLDAKINALAEDAELRYGVNGTPTFVIDGSALPSGYRTLDELTKPLDAELAKKL